MKSIRAQVITLGRATMLDRILQFVAPVALVRLLDITDFGFYRVFWLIISTVMAIASMSMAHSLLVFLPESQKDERRIFISNTILFLVASGIVFALLVAPWNPVVTDKLQGVHVASYILPAFVFLWIVASLVDSLPNADQAFRWQANQIIGLSITRLVFILGTAFITHDINAVFVVLLIFVTVKLSLLFYYVVKHHGWPFLPFDKPRFLKQFHYSFPFGIAGGLYSLRGYTEQWVVALRFRPEQFAVFSVASYVLPIVEIVRGSISNVLLPKISKISAEGDIQGMLTLNNKGNLAAGSIIFPALAYMFVFADEAVHVLFTHAYGNAAPIMRIYVIGMARLAVEITTILLVFRQGRYVMNLSFFLLLLSAIFSYSGASLFGLVGAALGSVLVLYFETVFTFRRAAQLTKIPLHRLQDWKGLAMLLLASCLAGLLAWTVMAFIVPCQGNIARLAMGGVVLSVSYLLLLHMFGYGWILKAYIGRESWKAA